jgi:hypothetical protein
MVGHRADMGEVLLVWEPDVAHCATSVVESKKRTSADDLAMSGLGQLAYCYQLVIRS